MGPYYLSGFFLSEFLTRLPWSGKSKGKVRFYSPSGSYVSGQGNSKSLFKVSEKSGDFVLSYKQGDFVFKLF